MPNHSNKQKTESLPTINFSASHDQARLSDKMSTEYTALKKIPYALRQIKTSLEDISPEEKTLAEQRELIKEIYEKQTTTIKLVEYSKQVVEDLHTTATKLNAIHQKSPEEKLEAARLQLKVNEPLNKDKEYRFKEIEEVLCNTCIIKAAGDETIKFQLGVLSDAREKGYLSESEFNHLVILRLKQNNLLDSYRVRREGKMILKRTPLEICQAINKDFSDDVDYQASKDDFIARLRGIDFELSSEKLLDNSWKKRGLERSDSLWETFNATAPSNTVDDLEGKASDLPKLLLTSSERALINADGLEGKAFNPFELVLISSEAASNTVDSLEGKAFNSSEFVMTSSEAAVKTKEGLEKKSLILPEIEDTDLMHEARLELIKQDLLRTLNIEAIKAVNLQFNKNKSYFVGVIEELIPKERSKEIIIDDITPTPIEKIMKTTLASTSPVSHNAAVRINYAYVEDEIKQLLKARDAYLKILKDPSSFDNGDHIHEDVKRKNQENLNKRNNLRIETKPCLLESEELVNNYREVINVRLKDRKESTEKDLTDLYTKYKNHYDEYRKSHLKNKHGSLSSDQKKQIRKKVYLEDKRKLNGQLEEINKQTALWKGRETFIKNVYNEKAEIIKQERIAFPTKELNFRDLVLNYNPNHQEQQQKINAYRDGVYVVSSKKTKSVSAGLEKSDNLSDNRSQSRLSANRVSYKEQFSGLSSSSLFATISDSKGLKNQEQEKLKAVKYRTKVPYGQLT